MPSDEESTTHLVKTGINFLVNLPTKNEGRSYFVGV